MFTEFTWYPKVFAQFVVFTKPHLVNTEDHFWYSVYRARLVSKGFLKIKELRLIILCDECSRLMAWLLVIVTCIWADLIIWKVYMKDQVANSSMDVCESMMCELWRCKKILRRIKYPCGAAKLHLIREDLEEQNKDLYQQDKLHYFQIIHCYFLTIVAVTLNLLTEWV